MTKWEATARPAEAVLRQTMEAAGLIPLTWSNGPFERYTAHSYEYDKVIYVVSGSITFGLPMKGLSLALGPGDRLDLPDGTVHDAIVGENGVVCLEAHVDDFDRVQ